MKKQLTQIDTIIYQSKSGALELKTDKKHETIWLTQDQMVSLFDVQKAAISKHLKNIFDSEELYEKSAVSILETTAKDNKIYKIKHFNLDSVLSVGYRINSKKATHFLGYLYLSRPCARWRRIYRWCANSHQIEKPI